MANLKTEQKPAQPAGILDDYMFDQLKNTREYGRYLEDKGERTLNYYLAFMTAIVGVVAGLLVVDKPTPIQSYTALFLGSLFLGGVGVLVYFWEMTFASARIEESLYTTILHLYFRKKDPGVYDKYGLPKLLTVLRRLKTPRNSPLFTAVSLISIQLIGIFSSGMLGLSLWSFNQLAPFVNLTSLAISSFSIIQESVVFAILLYACLLLVGYFGYYRSVVRFHKDINTIVKNL